MLAGHVSAKSYGSWHSLNLEVGGAQVVLAQFARAATSASSCTSLASEGSKATEFETSYSRQASRR